MASRQSKRRMERQKTLYKLTNNMIESRVLPDDNTVDDFIKALESDSQSKFGLVHLSKYNLNQIYNGKTLLEIACEKDRDFIVFNMLRSGVDPTVSADNVNGTESSNDIIAFLRQKWPAFACWIIKLVVKLRPSSINGNCGICKVFTKTLLLNCGDIICEDCCWDSIVLKVQFDDPICSVCNATLNETPHVDGIKLFITVAESKLLFEAMPEKVVGNSNLKKPKFKALSMFDLNRMFLGGAKEQRLNVFFKCCLTGNASKLRNVIEQGVDVNFRNEYGQTGLFVAAWKQQKTVVDILRDYNADATIPDHSNIVITPDYKIPVISAFKASRSPAFKLKCPIAGQQAFYIDGGFHEDFLFALENLLDILPIAKAQKAACSDRLYYSDSTEWVSQSICNNIVMNFGKTSDPLVMPDMRFLWYKSAGGFLPPHIDLSRTNENGQTSTHTFIIYLRDIDEGGETRLLERLPPLGVNGIPVSSVKPKRGRLFCFPHISPHEGGMVVDVPKILLRGEIKLNNHSNNANTC